ncbi:hypothetical protein BpHYR1_031535 [Brachionus plicatilis]|uniref:Uncharacterized protein n=1 Tax=Brachionus plicatilis TaxID=10195 RepID=A0A3M7PXH0_BRAPC|nr:hypothetical protein BpHYR1_031535 [Brachionus plicatilis]
MVLGGGHGKTGLLDRPFANDQSYPNGKKLLVRGIQWRLTAKLEDFADDLESFQYILFLRDFIDFFLLSIDVKT